MDAPPAYLSENQVCCCRVGFLLQTCAALTQRQLPPPSHVLYLGVLPPCSPNCHGAEVSCLMEARLPQLCVPFSSQDIVFLVEAPSQTYVRRTYVLNRVIDQGSEKPEQTLPSTPG